MTWNNEQEQNTYREYGGYTGSSHYQEQAYTQQQQQAYQQPMQGARPIYDQPAFTVPSAPGDGRLAATLCYTFGWLSGLLFLLYGAHKPLVRFHALQSLIFFGAINLIDVVLIRMIVVTHHHWYMGPLWLLFFFLFMLLNFVAFVGWIVAMVQTAQGTFYKLPLVGNMLAKNVKLRTPPRW